MSNRTDLVILSDPEYAEGESKNLIPLKHLGGHEILRRWVQLLRMTDCFYHDVFKR